MVRIPLISQIGPVSRDGIVAAKIQVLTHLKESPLASVPPPEVPTT